MKAFRYGIIALVLVVGGVVAGAAASHPLPSTAGTLGIASHTQLESDLQMTQQMSVDVGPAMLASMPAQGMLARSADPAYVRALEQHQQDLDRMLARSPSR